MFLIGLESFAASRESRSSALNTHTAAPNS